MSFKEFREDGLLFADWLPWGALVKPHLMLNKDQSLMATFVYDEILLVKKSDLLDEIARFSRFLKGLECGWALYSEVRKRDEMLKYYLTLVYLPERTFKGDAKAVFEDGLLLIQNSFGKLCNVKLLEGQAYLNYLRSTICFDNSKVEMPEIPMYLDALLTQGIKVKDEDFRVNGLRLKIVSPTGFISERVHEVIEAMNSLRFDYRFVIRFLFMGAKDAKRENERYRSTWCQNRRSMMHLIENKEFNGVWGYYTAVFLVWDNGRNAVLDKANAVENLLNKLGIIAFVEENNDKDVWYGSIPGMVRSNVFPPMMPVADVTSFWVAPVMVDKK